VSIAFHVDDEETLPTISFLVWVLDDVEETAVSEVIDDLLKRDATVVPPRIVLVRVPVESFYGAIILRWAPCGNELSASQR